MAYLFDVDQSMNPPPEFIAYLRSDAPKLGDLPSFPVYFQLWAEGDLETFNTEYQVPKWAPGFYGFGSDGGGEMFAFDEKGRVFALPFIGMDPKEATYVCESWTEFTSRIENGFPLQGCGYELRSSGRRSGGIPAE